MAMTPEQQTIIQYQADGLTTSYVYPFLILQANSQNADIVVYNTPSGQPANPIADIVDYTTYSVTGVGNVNGGTVVFNIPPAQGNIITLSRQMDFSLTTNFAAVTNFNGANLDASLQRLLLLCQQNNSNFTLRALQYVIDTYLPTPLVNNLPLLTNIDNQVWISQGGNILAAVLQNDNMSTFRSQIASQVQGADGASLVGYYDTNTNIPQTLATFLNNLNLANNIFQPGMRIGYGGYTPPSGWLIENGQQVSRATYTNLLNAITFIQQGTTHSSASNITGLSDTSNMFIGMAVTGTGIPVGTTIASIVTPNSEISLSQNSTASAPVNITFYPWGAGDSLTTFNVPDSRRRVSMGAGGTNVSDPTFGVGTLVGQKGGQETHVQTVAEIATHTPTTASVSIAGHTPITNSNATSGGSGASKAQASPGAVNLPLVVDTATVTLNPIGSSSPMNIIQPVLISTMIIKT